MKIGYVGEGRKTFTYEDLKRVLEPKKLTEEEEAERDRKQKEAEAKYIKYMMEREKELARKKLSNVNTNRSGAHYPRKGR
jgi:hypothetical protein